MDRLFLDHLRSIFLFSNIHFTISLDGATRPYEVSCSKPSFLRCGSSALTERKNPHTPVYGVKEFVCLSVTKFDPNIYQVW